MTFQFQMFLIQFGSSGNCHSHELYLLFTEPIFFQGDMAGVTAKPHKSVQDLPMVQILGLFLLNLKSWRSRA